MAPGLSKSTKSKGSIEVLVKDALISLSETPGSTFNSILDYLKIKYKEITKSKVLAAMKKMRKKGKLIQIKYWFRLAPKQVSIELKKHSNVLPIPIPVVNYKTTIGSRVRKKYRKNTAESEPTPPTSLNGESAAGKHRTRGKRERKNRFKARTQKYKARRGMRRTRGKY